MPGTMNRLKFATSAMHSYAHQWQCQLVFGPRMLQGMGLTDGEGVERLWSRLCALIAILRYVSVRVPTEIVCDANYWITFLNHIRPWTIHCRGQIHPNAGDAPEVPPHHLA